MAIPPKSPTTPTRAAIHPGTGHNVVYFKALAFCETDLPNTLTSKAKARIEPSAVAMTRCSVTSEAVWRSRALNGNGSVLAFCEAVSLSAFVPRCWFTSEAAWDSRALNGDCQCWLSVRLFCVGHFHDRLITAALGLALDVFRFGRAVATRCWLTSSYFRGYMEQPRC